MHRRDITYIIKWEETTVVDQARTPKELLLKEAIHIRLLKPPLNRDGGLELPGCWMAALGAGIQRRVNRGQSEEVGRGQCVVVALLGPANLKKGERGDQGGRKRKEKKG